jgi:hypothetical protein
VIVSRGRPAWERRMAKKHPASDHRTFPNPDSVLARRARKEARYGPLFRGETSQDHRPVLIVSEDEIRKAASIPSRQFWSGGPPKYTASQGFRHLCEDIVTEKVPIALDESLQAGEFRKSSHDAAYQRTDAIAGSLITALFVQSSLECQPEAPSDLGEIKRLRRERAAAAKRETHLRDSVPEDEHDPNYAKRLKSWLGAQATLVLARCRLKAAVERMNMRQNDLPNPSRKYLVSQKFAAIQPLIHELFYVHDLSDPTIRRLLRAVGLPTPTRRNIKQIRLSYRHSTRRPQLT